MAIAKVFFDVQANLGLPGLVALARERRVKMDGDSFLMFMNRKRTRVKIMFNETCLFQYAKDGNIQITMEELKALPGIVKGNWFEDAKVKEKIGEWLDRPISSNTSMVKVA